MKECLKCGKEFQEKKETAKFCSTSCRVMYNRNRADKVKKVNNQVVQNQILEAIGDLRDLIKSANINVAPMPTVFDSPKSNMFNDEPKQYNEQIINRKPKSVVKYVSERLQIETPEGFEAWSEELDSDPFLSDRDKKDARTKFL